MRIAVPIWENRISPVLDTATRLLILDIEDQKEVSRFETVLDEHDIHRRCMRFKGLGIEVVICGAVSHQFLGILLSYDMNVIPGISGDPEEVFSAYMKGILGHKRFLMPGFKKKRHCGADNFYPNKDCQWFQKKPEDAG